VRLEVTREGAAVVLLCADDGRGCDQDRRTAALREGHLGLAACTERVEAIGGVMEVRSPGRGTVVRAAYDELTRAGVVRAERPTDHEEIVAEPDGVAALDRPGRLDPPDDRDAALAEPVGDDSGLLGAVRLARAERDRAVRDDEERIEDVAQIGIGGRLMVEGVDPDAKVVEGRDEAVVLALGRRQVTRPEEAVRPILEGGSEGRTRSLHLSLGAEQHGGSIIRPGNQIWFLGLYWRVGWGPP